MRERQQFAITEDTPDEPIEHMRSRLQDLREKDSANYASMAARAIVELYNPRCAPHFASEHENAGVSQDPP